MQHVTKTFSIFKSEFSEKAQKGEFTAYLSAFDVLDLDGDIVDSHAFDEDIRSKSDYLFPLLSNHNINQPLGGFTIGKDNVGLKIDGFFDLDPEARNSDASKIYSLMKKGVIKQFSAGFYVIDAVWEMVNEKSVRRFTKAKLIEGSATPFPANPQSVLLDIKSSIKSAASVREVEEILKQKFSQNESKIIISKIKEFSEERDASADSQREAAFKAKIAAIASEVAQLKTLI